MTTPPIPYHFEYRARGPGQPRRGVAGDRHRRRDQRLDDAHRARRRARAARSRSTWARWPTRTGRSPASSPARRIAYEEDWASLVGHPGADVTPLATEFLVEARSGGTCVVRVVTSAFGTGADWEDDVLARDDQRVGTDARQPAPVHDALLRCAGEHDVGHGELRGCPGCGDCGGPRRPRHRRCRRASRRARHQRCRRALARHAFPDPGRTTGCGVVLVLRLQAGRRVHRRAAASDTSMTTRLRRTSIASSDAWREWLAAVTSAGQRSTRRRG